MSLFSVFAVLISVTAVLAWVNEKTLRLPSTIGVMAAALIFSLLAIGAGALGLGLDEQAESLFARVDFGSVLMQGMLSFLLFAGALHVNMQDLLERRWTILVLATFGVVLSTVLLGTAFWWLLGVAGLSIPYGYALLFGALISPTDPIAVLGVLRRADAPKQLESMIIGESLFNDGVGVVVFTMILGFVAGGHRIDALEAGTLFVEEAVGGVVFGFGLGWLAYRMLRTVNNHLVEILLTLALVSGGYALAGALHTSGPIAMVVAGLFIGNHGRVFGMTETSRAHLDQFWEVVDEILNALLFTLIGLEILVLELRPVYVFVGLAAIPLVLGVRLVCVGLPIAALRSIRTYPRGTVALMTWGGVRGGISIALALSIPPSPQRDLLLVVTYAVVVFSILFQGLSVGRLVRWATRTA